MEIEPVKILPPLIRRPPDRPKKHRRREVGEAPRVIPSRKRGEVKCGTCGRNGHNKRTCIGGMSQGVSRRTVGESSQTNVVQESNLTRSNAMRGRGKSSPHFPIQGSAV